MGKKSTKSRTSGTTPHRPLDVEKILNTPRTKVLRNDPPNYDHLENGSAQLFAHQMDAELGDLYPELHAAVKSMTFDPNLDWTELDQDDKDVLGWTAADLE